MLIPFRDFNHIFSFIKDNILEKKEINSKNVESAAMNFLKKWQQLHLAAETGTRAVDK
jgi:hypothetical protein